MQEKILVTIDFTEEQKEILEQAAPNAQFEYVLPKQVTEKMVHGADIIVGNPKPEFLKGAQHLKLLQLQSAGANQYSRDCIPEGCVFACATGTYGLAISEYMVACVLQIFNHLNQYHDNQKTGTWKRVGHAKSIFGSTALIVGLGDIGGEFAKRIKALGGYTIGVRRTDLSKPEYLDEIHLTDELDRLLPRADIVALSLPSTPQTYHIIDAQRLSLMKEDAVLVNVGRGNAIDMDALCETLNSGKLLGAALDVTDPEPLPPEHPLWSARGAHITPHMSGGGTLPETQNRLARHCASNIKAFLEGKPLKSVVDLKTGYRKLDS